MEMVKYLISNGANLETSPEYEGTPLMIAVESDNYEMVKLLVENGAKIDGKSNEGVTVFDTAISNGNPKIANYLIAKGIDISKMKTADWAAIGNLEKVKADIKNGKSIDLPNSKGFTPLEASLSNKHINVAKYLIENGAVITTKAIRYPAGYGDLDVIRFLVDKGADVNGKESYGLTVLMSASGSGNLKLVEYLVEQGTDINVTDNSGETALFDATKKGDLVIVKYLLSKGMDINAKNTHGDTVTDVAFFYGNMKTVKHFIENGADQSGIDINIWARLGDEDKVKSLLSSTKVEINATNGSLLINAVRSGNLKLVKFLVEKGANIHEETFEEGNALIAAVSGGYLDIVKYLVEQGINVNTAIEYTGETATQIAKDRGYIKIVEYLNSKQKAE